MTMERIRYLGNTYFFNPEKPNFYMYDHKAVAHIIIYTLRDYGGTEYIAEWKIPGTEDKDILYARRLALRLPPWDVTKSDGKHQIVIDNVRTTHYTKRIETF